MTKRRRHDPRLHEKMHDPLQAAKRQTPGFNRLWLKAGASMTLTQRIGYTIFSLAYFACGLYLLDPLMSNWRSSGADSIVFTVLFGLASLFFLVFGILGLRNVLGFKR
jgi:hypothetical protein